jgi:hypothetical protein
VFAALLLFFSSFDHITFEEVATVILLQALSLIIADAVRLFAARADAAWWAWLPLL